MMWGSFLISHAWHLVALVLLLIGSGFFSGSETSLFSLSRGQLYRLRQSGRGGGIIASLMRRPRRTLNTLLLGNMLVNVGFAALSALMIYDLKRAGVASWTLAVASLVPLLALILFGEVGPKMLAYTFGGRWAVLSAGMLKVAYGVLGPLLWVFDKVFISPLTRIIVPSQQQKADITSEELAALLDVSAKQGILDHGANKLLQEILDLTDLRVSHIMVPRVDMIAYDADGPHEGLRKMFRRTHLRRIPLYEHDLDHTIGVVHYKQVLLDEPAPLREIAVPVPFVPEAGNLEQLLAQFIANKTQMAIVVDEYGGTAGVVTLQDVLEEIVGDLPDQYSAVRPEPSVQRIGDNRYLIDGDLPIHEWAQPFGVNFSNRRISTIGGFVTSLLGRIANPGDVATYHNLRFTIKSMRARRVDKCVIELLEEAQ